jgi:exonuclease III
VGIVLSQRAEEALLEWIPINSRLCAVRLAGSCKVARGRDINRCLYVVSAYAPTDCSSESLKDEFYSQLNDLLRKAPRSDIVVLAGDLNARVGRLNLEEAQLGGPHGLDSHRNDNGERLLSVCMDNGLFLASLNFRHRKRHLATWPPTAIDQAWTQIDHIAISYRWRGCINDCRSYWTTCVESDHALVCAKIAMRFCGRRRVPCKRIDVKNLCHPSTLDRFQQDLESELNSHAPPTL